MREAGLNAAQLAELDVGQIRAMLRQLRLDGEQRRLEALVGRGELSAGDATAAMAMLVEDGGEGEV